MDELKQENMSIKDAKNEKATVCEQQSSKHVPANAIVIFLRIALIISALLVMIAPFLPYASFGFLGFVKTFSLVNNEGARAGIYMVLSGLIPLLLALFWPKRILLLIFSLIPIGLFFAIKIQIDLYLGIAREALTPAIGYYLLFVATIVLVISGILFSIFAKNNCKSK